MNQILNLYLIIKVPHTVRQQPSLDAPGRRVEQRVDDDLVELREAGAGLGYPAGGGLPGPPGPRQRTD